MSSVVPELAPDPDADGLVGGSVMWDSDVLPNSKWRFRDGSELSRADFSLLFARIGTRHGVGDGSTTFNLPNDDDMYFRGAGTAAGEVGDSGGSASGAVTASGFSSFDGTGSTSGESGSQTVQSGTGANVPASPHVHLGPSHQHSTTVTGTAEVEPPFTAVRFIIKVM